MYIPLLPLPIEGLRTHFSNYPHETEKGLNKTAPNGISILRDKKMPLPLSDTTTRRGTYIFAFSEAKSIGWKLKMKKVLIIAMFLCALPSFSQSTTGELRLIVTDSNGLGLKSTVELVSQGNEYRNTFITDNQGNLDAKRLPYGIYQVQIRAQGFAEISEPVEIRSALPVDRAIRLKVGSVSESVKVSELRPGACRSR
jgi:hypothetical protein